ncbi:MAG: glycosyltransferase family 4 protein [Leptolyngbya sp. SIO4C1]|nr:glycosyltransferase family 4 protein [Leptolyngbya sp. SIO4C1]
MRLAYITGEYPRATDTFVQRDISELRSHGAEVFTFSVRKTGEEHMVGAEQIAERKSTFYIISNANPVSLALAHTKLLLKSPGRYLQTFKLAWQIREKGLRGTLYQLFYFAEAGLLANQVLKLQIQHLHNHFAYASCNVTMLAAELCDRSFSFSVQGPTVFFNVDRWRLDEKIKRALFVRCISNFCRSQCMIFAPPEKWNRLHIIHCGVKPALFETVKHNRPGRHLLYVGRLAAVKGLPVLFESLARLKDTNPDMMLTVVGDGAERASLEQMTVDLGIDQNVDFVGYKSQAEVRQYMQQSDVFVLPSFAEGLPIVLMEALGAGVPAVSTQIAGNSDLVEDGVSGYLVAPGDAAAMADRIGTLLNDTALRAEFGAAGRAKVEAEFDIHHEVGLLYRVIESALKGEVEPVRPAATMQSSLPEAVGARG